MTEKQHRRSGRPRSSIEKAAFVAVGAPTAVLKALNARMREMRDTMRSSPRELSDELAAEIDEWIAEGEKVIGRATERLRASELMEEVKTSARSTREAARVGMNKVAELTGSGPMAVIPDEELTVIRGVGPGYADRLRGEGIVGVVRFLERTETPEHIDDLALSTGIAADTIASWRRQVDLGRIPGVSESHHDLLHRAGIWTVGDLADSEASELVGELRALEPDQAPSEERVIRWKTEAAQLDD